MTNLDSILKSRDITLSTKVRLVKAMVFPVVIYGCESWTIKKAEHRRIDAFELWCWRRLLRVPWTSKKSNQSILKEISPRCSLEGLMLKLKLQYFGNLMQRADSFEKTLTLAKAEGKRRREWQRMRWLHSITDSMDMNLNKCWEIVENRGTWHATVDGIENKNKRIRHALPTDQQYSLNMRDTASLFNENFIEVSVDVYTVIINNKDAGNFSQIPQMVIFYIQEDFCLVTLVIGCFYFILFISFLISLQANLRFSVIWFVFLIFLLLTELQFILLCFFFFFLISCLSKVLLFGLTVGLSATLPLNTG